MYLRICDEVSKSIWVDMFLGAKYLITGMTAPDKHYADGDVVTKHNPTRREPVGPLSV